MSNTGSTHPEQERKNFDTPHGVPKSPDAGGENLANAEVRNVVNEMTSETGSENAGQTTSAAQASSQAQRAAFEQNKKELLAAQPPQEKMVEEINTKLKTEIKKLKSEERHYRHSGDLSNFNKIVARLREINEMLDTIAHAAYEILKKIWLKVVHGIV